MKKAEAIFHKGGKCEKCGYDKHPAALQFHHLIPSQKQFAISNKMSLGIKRIMKEVSKCQLLCGNCHAVITCEDNRR